MGLVSIPVDVHVSRSHCTIVEQHALRQAHWDEDTSTVLRLALKALFLRTRPTIRAQSGAASYHAQCDAGKVAGELRKKEWDRDRMASRKALSTRSPGPPFAVKSMVLCPG